VRSEGSTLFAEAALSLRSRTVAAEAEPVTARPLPGSAAAPAAAAPAAPAFRSTPTFAAEPADLDSPAAAAPPAPVVELARVPVPEGCFAGWCSSFHFAACSVSVVVRMSGQSYKIADTDRQRWGVVAV
jgi:hypothetical protein